MSAAWTDLTPAAAAVLAAQPYTCRYPVAGREFRFCGEPVATRIVLGDRKRLSYCQACAGLAYSAEGLKKLKLEGVS